MIVKFISVDVMRYFSRIEGAAKFFLYDKDMLKNISFHVSPWMRPHFNFLVSIFNNERSPSARSVTRYGTILRIKCNINKGRSTFKACMDMARIHRFRFGLPGRVAISIEPLIVALAISFAINISVAYVAI